MFGKKRDKGQDPNRELLAIMAATLYVSPLYGEIDEAIDDAEKILDRIDARWEPEE